LAVVAEADVVMAVEAAVAAATVVAGVVTAVEAEAAATAVARAVPVATTTAAKLSRSDLKRGGGLSPAPFALWKGLPELESRKSGS